MKAILITVLLAVTTAHAAPVIQPLVNKPETFQVDGHDVNSATALQAKLAGKSVKHCKAMSGVQGDKTFLINGKEVKGTSITQCKDQILAETKKGINLKDKK